LSSLVNHASQTQAAASSAYSSLLEADHLPSPPVYLPRLTALLTSLNQSKEATLAVVKARTDLVRLLESLLERQKRELKKSEGLLAEVDEQVKGVQATRDEVEIMLSGSNNGDNIGNEVRSTTPDIEPPVVEALTPPAGPVEELNTEGDVMQGLDDLAGLGELEPEIVALLRADMELNRRDSTNLTTGHNDEIDDYAP
jgi:hypothetical protein